MSALRNYLNKIKPNFQEGGKLHAFESVFDGFESFLYVPNTTAKSGASIHDSIDSKRIMSFVVIALIPALLFGMYNVGYQNFKACLFSHSSTFPFVCEHLDGLRCAKVSLFGQISKKGFLFYISLTDSTFATPTCSTAYSPFTTSQPKIRLTLALVAAANSSSLT